MAQLLDAGMCLLHNSTPEGRQLCANRHKLIFILPGALVDHNFFHS
jgi:hypothetical protein